MAQEDTAAVRTEQYTRKGKLEIRAVGTEEFYVPPHWEGADETGFSNVIRPTFKPGTMSVFQQVSKPACVSSRLESDLYMWKATFNIADLHHIRVRERSNGANIHMELLAVCTAPPIGRGLVAKAGSNIDEIFKVAVDTSEPIASSVAITNLSDRWASGEQEINLYFARASQIKPNPGPSVWVWSTFLAFLCGVEWSTQKFAFVAHAQSPLDMIVNSRFPNPYAEFEQKDGGWILIKIKPKALPRSSVSVLHVTFSDGENRRRDKHVERFADSVADPSTARLTFPDRPPPTAESSNPPYLDANLSLPVLGAKRKATEEAKRDWRGRGMELETRQQLERDLERALCTAEISEEEERKWREKKEAARETARLLKLHLYHARRASWKLQASATNSIDSSRTKTLNEWLNDEEQFPR